MGGSEGGLARERDGNARVGTGVRQQAENAAPEPAPHPASASLRTRNRACARVWPCADALTSCDGVEDTTARDF